MTPLHPCVLQLLFIYYSLPHSILLRKLKSNFCPSLLRNNYSPHCIYGEKGVNNGSILYILYEILPEELKGLQVADRTFQGGEFFIIMYLQ